MAPATRLRARRREPHAMKVYGKFAKSTRAFTRPIEDSNGEKWFSSDDENADRSISDDTTRISGSQDPILDSQGTENRGGSRSSCVAEDTVWDFLDKPKVKRRRVKKVEEAEASPLHDENVPQAYAKAVNTMNAVMTSLHSPTEVVEKMASSIAIENEEELLTGQIRYGRTRTILFKEGEDPDALSGQEEGDDCTEPSDGHVSQHFNELKTMGESLQHQDDLDFILNSTDGGSSWQRLLRLCLHMLNTQGFSEFILKYHHKQVWKWCFESINPVDKTLSIMQCFLIDRLPLKKGDPLWGMINLEGFILPLVANGASVPVIRGSRLSQLNLKEFLDKIAFPTPSSYALHIWNVQFPNFQATDDSLLVLQTILGERVDDTVLSVLLKCLPVSLTADCSQKEQYRSLFKRLATLVVDTPNGEDLIKCLIKLTNYSARLDLEKEHLSDLFHNMVKLIHGKQECFSKTDDLGLVNVFILYLGLCLNIVTDNDIYIGDGDMKLLHQVYENSFSVMGIDQQCSFMENLFLLVYAYSIHNGKRPGAHKDTGFLRSKLNAFSEEVRTYNESIYQQIKHILTVF